MGLGCVGISQFDKADTLFSEGLTAAREFGHRRFVSMFLSGMGVLETYRGKFDLAMAYATESLQIAQLIQTPWDTCIALNTFGEIHLKRGNLDDSIRFFEESLAIASRFRFVEQSGVILFRLAMLQSYREDLIKALEIANESLKLFVEIGYVMQHEVRAFIDNLGR